MTERCTIDLRFLDTETGFSWICLYEFDATTMAEDINNEATPDFKIELIMKLIDLDEALAWEIQNKLGERSSYRCRWCKTNDHDAEEHH